MKKRLGTGIGIACLSLLMAFATWSALAGTGAKNSGVRAEASTQEAPRRVGPERMELFFAGAGPEGRAELKQQVDAWLKDHSSGTKITGRSIGLSERGVIAAIWYQTLE